MALCAGLVGALLHQLHRPTPKPIRGVTTAAKSSGIIVASDDFESYPDGADVNGLNGAQDGAGHWWPDEEGAVGSEKWRCGFGVLQPVCRTGQSNIFGAVAVALAVRKAKA